MARQTVDKYRCLAINHIEIKAFNRWCVGDNQWDECRVMVDGVLIKLPNSSDQIATVGKVQIVDKYRPKWDRLFTQD